MKFYPQRWAKYEEAVPGTLRLVPPEYRFDELRRDYAGMREMMFGEYPEFDSMMDCIKQLEEEINRK
jgi:predicted aminopeptidase